MMGKRNNINKNQTEILCLDQLVPEDHLVRKLDKAIDLNFIYDLVEDLYSPIGSESIDPVVLIKIVMIQYIFGIRSMRQTIKEITVNTAYRWYLGYGLTEKIPHFSTFSKNYSRRFEGTDLFEQIFAKILEEIIKHGFIDEENIFIDATHIKANANTHKCENKKVEKSAKFYEEELTKEINEDRNKHGKQGVKKSKKKEEKNQKISTTDPDSGLFHKGEHKKVFAYTASVACDANNFILGLETSPGNVHDSRVFPKLYNKLKEKYKNMEKIVVDAGYKIPAIARMIIEDGKIPVMPYKRPMTKKGNFKKKECMMNYNCYMSKL